MGSRTKEQRAQEETIKRMIVDGYRRGVCDKEGHSVRNKDGHLVARPRYLGPTAKRIKV